MIYGRKQCDPVSGCGKHYDQFLNACPHCNTPEAFGIFKAYNPLDWIYDLETYPNIFTADFKHPATGTRQLFEISDRRNNAFELYSFLNALAAAKCRMVGYNNVGFDYPIIHFFIQQSNAGYFPDVNALYTRAQQILNTPWERRFDNIIWDNDRFIEQIDLFKIHHFDNDARRTSLKMLEFNMRLNNISDLPFPPGTVLNSQQQDELIIYNDDDIDATERFYFHSLEMIEFREQLGEKHGQNFLNHSDKKIGTDLFISAIEQAAPGTCYTYNTAGKRIPRQTIRDRIALADVIFPYINFKEPEFNRVLNWLKAQVITETKGVFDNLSATVKGFTYDFGTGGIHGSIDPAIVESDNDYVIYDWDVAGYYPEIGGANNLYPEHLSAVFCAVNEALKQERKKYKKGTALNKSIKLSRNGAFGDSNNKYSVFLDPQYMLAITINGQLMLCMLAQYLIDIPGLQMIQVNTDGLTVRCPRRHVDSMIKICDWWQQYTCLELEKAIYSRMFIRDVNNYIAEKENGELKRKGAYGYETPLDNPDTGEIEWHKNHSALIVPKAAEAALVHGQCIRDFIEKHNDIFDFMLRTKVGRQDRLVMRTGGNEKDIQKISRYYISTAPNAGALFKIAPPAKGYQVGQWKRATKLTDEFYNAVRAELRVMDLSNVPACELDSTGLPWDERINTKSRTKYEMRETGYHVGYMVEECNDIRKARRENINIDYYVAEVEKLVNPVRGVV